MGLNLVVREFRTGQFKENSGWHDSLYGLGFGFVCTDEDTAEYLYDALTGKEVTVQAILCALQELRETGEVYEDRVAAVWGMLTVA